jgi:multidrug resistance protein MdtO
MVVVFVATFAAGWVAAGSPRISYAGFQIAFAFFLCAVQGAAPAFDMTIARDRVIGMLLANFVVYLVFTKVWPITVAGRIDAAMASLLRKLSVMAAAARSRRFALASDACAALGAIEQDLRLARYEPSSVRPTNDWLDARSRAAAEMAALIGPLLLWASRNSSLGPTIARRLDMLAARFGEPSAGPVTVASADSDYSGSPGNLKAPPDSMDRQIVAGIQSLERTSLAQYAVKQGVGSYASA